MAEPPDRSMTRAPTIPSAAYAPQPCWAAAGGAPAPTKAKSSRAVTTSSASSGRTVNSSQALLLAKHRVLQALGEPELDDALRGNLDGLARLRVAAHARL